MQIHGDFYVEIPKFPWMFHADFWISVWKWCGRHHLIAEIHWWITSFTIKLATNGGGLNPIFRYTKGAEMTSERPAGSNPNHPVTPHKLGHSRGIHEYSSAGDKPYATGRSNFMTQLRWSILMRIQDIWQNVPKKKTPIFIMFILFYITNYCYHLVYYYGISWGFQRPRDPKGL